MKARTPSGPSTTQRENDVTSALTESGHERLRLPMELLGASFLPGRAHQWTGLHKGTITQVHHPTGSSRSISDLQITLLYETAIRGLGLIRFRRLPGSAR